MVGLPPFAASLHEKIRFICNGRQAVVSGIFTVRPIGELKCNWVQALFVFHKPLPLTVWGFMQVGQFSTEVD